MMDHLHFPIPILHKANPFAGQLDSSHHIMLRCSLCSSMDLNQEKRGALSAHLHLLINPGLQVTPPAAVPPPWHTGEQHTLPETPSNPPGINIHTALHYPLKGLGLAEMALGIILLKAASCAIKTDGPSPANSSKGC